jgi:hypothetical protein
MPYRPDVTRAVPAAAISGGFPHGCLYEIGGYPPIFSDVNESNYSIATIKTAFI